MERGRLQQRINERFDRMMRSGLLEEVSMLREHGFGRESYVANTYGYAELLAHIEGRISLATAVEEAKTKSRAYARRQLTWCRKLDDARWLEYTTADEAVEQLQPILTAVLTDEG
jgi:tRNA dimethylallyltransferase